MGGKIVLIFLLCTAFLSHRTLAIDSVRLEKRGENSFIIHQVEKGETLYAISKRYKADVNQIIAINRVQNSSIDIGQFLEIPYGEVKLTGKSHTVAKGETLYSIAKKYDVTVNELKDWNSLRTNSLDIGQVVTVGDFRRVRAVEETIKQDEPIVKTQTQSIDKPMEKPVTKEKYSYFVQTGDNLKSISEKFKVNQDSIIFWNDLKSTKLSIGQELKFPFKVSQEQVAVVSEVANYNKTAYGSKKRAQEEGGVKKVYEEGLAKQVDQSIETNKFLALHRTLRVGTVLQVRNLMNNETIYVRIVGKLPDTGINDNTMIRLTPVAFKRLGIIDDKALVEIIYFDN